MIKLDSLSKAIIALEVGFAEHAAYPELLTIRDGVIQRFEIAMDLSWKITIKVLREVYGVQSSDVLTKKDIFRQAAKYELLDDPEAWFGHYEARNDTSHIYDSDKAAQTFARARVFWSMHSYFCKGLQMPVVAIDLKPGHLALVRSILANQAPTYQAWAFGSRVQGTAQQFSDLDICLRADQPMSYEEKANLKLAFSESNLPFVVDIVDLNRCSAAFAQDIEQSRVLLS